MGKFREMKRLKYILFVMYSPIECTNDCHSHLGIYSPIAELLNGHVTIFYLLFCREFIQLKIGISIE